MPLVQTERKPTKLHYGWILVFTGVAVLFSCIGLGRFSLGMLLPSMGASLELSYSQMGFVSTGNLIGYLAGVVLAGIVANRAGARRTIVLGLLLVGGSMALIAFAATFHEVLFLYIVTGVGSALANVPMMGLVAHWFLKSLRGRAAGTILTGNALAIVFTGFFMPSLNTEFGADGWRIGWLAMGAVSLAVTVIAAILLRNSPAEKGLFPLGTENGSSSRGSDPDAQSERKSYRGTLVHLGFIFALFGATQVVYATFIVTVMVTERGFGEAAAGTFWSVVGAFSIFSGQLFGRLSDKLGRKAGMMIVYVLFTVSFSLAAADLSNGYLFISIAVFGLSMWSIPTIMYAAAGDYMGPARAAAAIGFITLFCGAGQVVGPAAAGILADKAGTFHIVFWLCALLSASAVLLTFFLKSP